MAMSDNTGGPAFPFTIPDTGHGSIIAKGMTLRDWFAGQALVSLLSNRESQMALYADASIEGKDTTTYVAEAVFEMADAMLAARKAGA
jgi:hypothetical protein